jgi:hypothetical protein
MSPPFLHGDGSFFTILTSGLYHLTVIEVRSTGYLDLHVLSPKTYHPMISKPAASPRLIVQIPKRNEKPHNPVAICIMA